MSNFPQGFEGMQARLDAMVEALGGSHFARVAVANELAGALRRVVNDRLGFAGSHGLTFAEYVLASRAEFDTASSTVEQRVYREMTEPSDAVSASVHGGVIALRGTCLWFETSRAALLLAHAYVDACHRRRAGKDRWSVSLTEEAKAYFFHAGGSEPAQSSTGAGSRDGAVKSLRRLAEVAFRAPLSAGDA
ncbi:hypothetical protein D3869_26865 (plasmid) [Azospirillum brasilense]|uniref:Uncharacterized protein n=1 Tax=Azospirillum brasilense TaxID=192 RepID=A0A4D8RQ39_AZOBR|nr:hypothetical protein [Azospirillum brasilense]QCO18892.1 hypothetical protein D3869_26865 [Azospirillum brasilense]